jgi:hypothetical protein
MYSNISIEDRNIQCLLLIFLLRFSIVNLAIVTKQQPSFSIVVRQKIKTVSTKLSSKQIICY